MFGLYINNDYICYYINNIWMNFKDFKRKHKFETFYNAVVTISNKMANFYTYNNRWYINILYFVLFSGVCLNFINGDTNVLEFSPFIVGLITVSYTIFKWFLIGSGVVYFTSQVIRFIIFCIKKMTT